VHEWASEVGDTLAALTAILAPTLADGGRKRAAGLKPHWLEDDGHATALLRHWVAAECASGPDPDSGACPWAHVAARALMLAGQAQARRAAARG
jgi:hypothetical protein